MNSGAFYPLWKKYKPAILQMMKSAVGNDSQQYKLSKHEFEDVKPVQNMVIPFKMVLKNGGKSKMEKKSLPAEDLIAILKYSNTAVEMLESSEFTLQLDRQFVFHVSANAIESAEQ